ncbi:MAG: hypothetical protein ACFB6S_07975 [Geminicoccaceae bacterium]
MGVSFEKRSFADPMSGAIRAKDGVRAVRHLVRHGKNYVDREVRGAPSYVSAPYQFGLPAYEVAETVGRRLTTFADDLVTRALFGQGLSDRLVSPAAWLERRGAGETNLDLSFARASYRALTRMLTSRGAVSVLAYEHRLAEAFAAALDANLAGEDDQQVALSRDLAFELIERRAFVDAHFIDGQDTNDGPTADPVLAGNVNLVCSLSLGLALAGVDEDADRALVDDSLLDAAADIAIFVVGERPDDAWSPAAIEAALRAYAGHL